MLLTPINTATTNTIQTFTNKTITQRVFSTTDDATAVIDCNSYDEYYLTAIANALDLTVQHIKDKISDVLLRQDNAESIFVSLNNGDIKTQFGSIHSYIRFLHTNFEIEYNLVADILSLIVSFCSP